MERNNSKAVYDFLYQILCKQSDEKALIWLNEKISQMENAFTTTGFYMSFAAATRFFGKKALELSGNDLENAYQLREGFYPQNWTTDQTTRTILLLKLPTDSQATYQSILNQLFETADVHELIALYAALPLLSFPEMHAQRCAEGIRSNMTSVFEAIALHNPYPSEYLDENAWNQLFMKAIFTNRPIYKMQGIEKRANANLARICSDFAHERWAAGRTVSPELWRPISSFLDEKLIEDIKKVLPLNNPIQQQAAQITLWENEVYKFILPAEIQARFEQGNIPSWDEIGKAWEITNNT